MPTTVIPGMKAAMGKKHVRGDYWVRLHIRGRPAKVEDILFELRVMSMTNMIGSSGTERQNCSEQKGQNR